MTRARNTLILARMTVMDGVPPALFDVIGDAPCLLRRASVSLPAAAQQLWRRHVRLTLRETDIGFAGCYPEGHVLHHTIAALPALIFINAKHAF